MLQSNPKQKNAKKSGKKAPYVKSKSKREAKGEPQSNPLTYTEPIAYQY